MRLKASAAPMLAGGAAAFGLVYYTIAGAPGADLPTGVLLLLPPVVAMILLLRASGEGGRAKWFWRLLALGPALWLVAEGLWTWAEYQGRGPRLESHGAGALATDVFFISFLVPMIGAVGLRPHPRPRRRDSVALADFAIVLIALSFVFLRVVFLPLRNVDPSQARSSFVLGALTFVLSAWTAWLWRRVEDADWRRTYGAVALFAFLYGTLSAVANGMGREMLPRGGPVDVAWFVPFFVLAAAATRARSGAARRVPSAAIVLVAGPGPLLLHELLRTGPPALGLAFAPQPILLLVTSALLAVACGARLLLEERREQEAQARERASSDESRRAGRLGTLAALTAGIVQELERATDEVALRARSVAPLMGSKADRVVGQAERARGIVRGLVTAFRGVPPGERRPVDVGRILEDTVRSGLDEGLPLRVSLEETGHLPDVVGDPGALGAAFLNVVRNAAQASPGGVLRISAATDGREVVVRFRDDGPGVPAVVRDRIFDPFFTTRRVGEGVGLGLTQAHFVAHDHVGSVVLEPSRDGACFVFRLPARERRAARPVPDAWPLSGAALLSAAMATTLSLLAPGSARAWAGLLFQVASAALAALALALAGAGMRERGRARWFWALLAAGPAIWALTRIGRAVEGGPEGAPGHGVWQYVLYAVAELVWMAALLLRPDRERRSRPPLRALLGAGAVLCVFAYLYAYLVVLPWPFAEGDPQLGRQVALVRGLLRAALAGWAIVLARTAASDYWRVAFERLALVFVVWAVGQTAAGYARSAGYRGGSLPELGWIVPYLLLAAVALAEGRRRSKPERHFVSTRRSPGAAASLAAVAALPAFDAIVGRSLHPALDAARDDLTAVTVVALGVILVLRELLAERDGTPLGAAAATAATRSPRLPGLVASAAHELGGQLSGIAALARLVLAHSDLPARVREDARRIRGRADAALRIVNNVIVAVRGVSGLSQVASVNVAVQEAIEERGFDLAEEGIRLHPLLSDVIPPLTLGVQALRQALLCCVDAAATGLRGAGGGGTIELVTALDEDEGEVVVGVRAGDGALPRAALRQLGATPLATPAAAGELGACLGLAREIVSQLGGRLTGHNRRQGGTELWIRLPIAALAPPAAASGHGPAMGSRPV